MRFDSAAPKNFPAQCPVDNRNHPASPKGSRPEAPTYEQHDPFCFVCTLGPVLLLTFAVKLHTRLIDLTQTWSKGRFPVLARSFAPNNRSHAPPHAAAETLMLIRLSSVGLLSVLLLFGSRNYPTLLHLQDPEAFVASPYGRALGVKLVLVLLTPTPAGINRIWLLYRASQEVAAGFAVRYALSCSC